MYKRQSLYPEQFSDVDLVAMTKDYYQKMYNFTLTDEQAPVSYTHLDVYKRQLVWRAPEGPEGTGGLRGAAPNEVRP